MVPLVEEMVQLAEEMVQLAKEMVDQEMLLVVEVADSRIEAEGVRQV